MSWRIDKDEYDENPNKWRKVAKEDMKVYFIDGEVTPAGFRIYYGHPYIEGMPRGIINTEVPLIQIYDGKQIRIDTGYYAYLGDALGMCTQQSFDIHSWHNTYIPSAKEEWVAEPCRITATVTKTVHCLKGPSCNEPVEKYHHKCFFKTVIGEFIIPKGTEYYVANNYGMILTSKLFWTGKILETNKHEFRPIKFKDREAYEPLGYIYN